MNKKKYLLLVVFIIVVILISISTTLGPSDTVSRYRSEIDGESSARVAKWNVTTVTKKQGQSISLDAGFKANILEGTGNWFFDIENDSEVSAAINKKSSSITLKLAAEILETFDANKDGIHDDKISWDFLGTNNPVNFEIYVYNTSAENLLRYQNINDDTEISFSQYAEKTDAEKANYKEIIKDTGYAKTLVFKTDDSTKLFEKDTELIDSKLTTFYKLNLSLESTDFTPNLGLGDNKTNICFQVVWSVTSNGDPTTPTGETKTYNAHTIVEGTPPATATGAKSYYDSVNGKNYYIDIAQKEFFDYATYTSSLGGEPRFIFKNETSTAQISIPYSRLTRAQKDEIESYAELKNKTTFASLEELEHFVEYLEYEQYTLFVSDNKEFSEKLPYLSMGLKVSMQFNLLVEQVD